MSASDAPATVGDELRRRQMAVGWTLDQVAEQAQVSVGMSILDRDGGAASLAPLLAADPADPEYQRAAARGGVAKSLPERLQATFLPDTDQIAFWGAASTAEALRACGLPEGESGSLR